MNIYVASSWRNVNQQTVVGILKGLGHTVYDFKNPPNRSGFGWKQIASYERDDLWTPEVIAKALTHHKAIAGFQADMDGLKAADLVILVMPCGKSAHMEFGWAVGALRKTIYFQLEPSEPDLMIKMADHFVTSYEQLLKLVTP